MSSMDPGPFHHGGPGPSSTRPWQLPRLLILDGTFPSWADVHSNVCEALLNFFSLACSLAGPSRIQLLGINVARDQVECILPFAEVKGNFPRLQASVTELRSLPREEGRAGPGGERLRSAVQDGLRQFEQYNRHRLVCGSLNSSTLEITVLTRQPGKRIVDELERGLRDVNVDNLRRLQVIEISKGEAREPDEDEEWSPLLTEQTGSPESLTLGSIIDLQMVDNEVVSLEMFFKSWLQDQGVDREHLHLILPAASAPSAGPGAANNPVRLKCDIQERMLSPSLLSGPANGPGRKTGLGEKFPAPYEIAAHPGAPLYQLHVIRALRYRGVCESVLYGLPHILRPTGCWQLDWDELEENQHRFHALCHTLLKRGWLLLAESQFRFPGSGLRDPSLGSFYVILPSNSFTLLVKAVASRELLLPCPFPALPDDPEATALSHVESALDALLVEPTYNPRQAVTHLYLHLRRKLTKTPRSRSLAQRRERQSSEQAPPAQPKRARATVIPLLKTSAVSSSSLPGPPAGPKSSSEPPLFSKEDEEFLLGM
ncbi:meiosis 1 arrest protein [Tachyglossus aculeatus]|uniref:meiosis 1 arrest protein n=1 Tax=Tachyglossus aculeatus TaxID=9261 RepID=UPI0018F79123|nr:meiosis 1 arrest protein [Tachyglossus aculeatus]